MTTPEPTEPIEHGVCRQRTLAEQTSLAGADRDRAERYAQAYTVTFERLAPHFGFAVTVDPDQAWLQAPAAGRDLLTASFRELLPLIEQPLRDELSATTIDRDRWRRIVELLARAAAGREGAEYVAELAEALAAVSALQGAWAERPERAEAARELAAALAGAPHKLASTGA